MAFSDKQKKLIEMIRRAEDCGGHCDSYCYGCTAESRQNIKWAAFAIQDGRISADILLEARRPLRKI